MPWRRSVAGASIRGHGVDLCRRRSIRAAGASIPATAASIRAAPTTMASIRAASASICAAAARFAASPVDPGRRRLDPPPLLEEPRRTRDAPPRKGRTGWEGERDREREGLAFIYVCDF